MSIEIYLKCKYTYENAGFCILCMNDFKISKIFIKLSKFSTIFYEKRHRRQPPPPTPQRPYDVSRGENRYVTLSLKWKGVLINKYDIQIEHIKQK